MVITFCGHSDFLSTQEEEERLLSLLKKVIQGKPVDFYLGNYGNFDKFSLNCAKKYKLLYKNATLIFVTPYLGEWLDSRKDSLQATYDKIIYPELENVPPKFRILKRNEWMINQADHVFFYVNRRRGGAYQSLLYADKIKKNYINLYQNTFELK